jgi:hypothetical protein
MALDGWQADIWTALPGIYQGAGIDGTANVQPSVKGWVWDAKGKASPTQYPLCVNCPILWPGGGGFQLTFPLTAGTTEGLLIFAARSIDAWWKHGGVQPQVDFRKHNLSDGFFLPSPCGRATAASSVSSDSAQLRSTDGNTYVELSGGNIVNIVAPGGVNITADVTITGKLTTTSDAKITGKLEVDDTLTAKAGAAVTGALTATGAITAGFGGLDQVGVQTHRHTANNQPPTAGT